jgi:peptide/nickel transport system substrate-binding protein
MSSLVILAVLVGSLVFAVPDLTQAAETPRRGGVLLAVIGADPPTLDPHQEGTFATLQVVAPLYSTLLQIDPYSYPKIIGDVATEWKISTDALTYTFKIRPGIRFHDGSPLTAADMPGLWWTRNVVHWAKVKNYVAPPSHYTNQKLQDVWLADE